jgi:hypothetical protein
VKTLSNKDITIVTNASQGMQDVVFHVLKHAIVVQAINLSLLNAVSSIVIVGQVLARIPAA